MVSAKIAVVSGMLFVASCGTASEFGVSDVTASSYDLVSNSSLVETVPPPAAPLPDCGSIHGVGYSGDPGCLPEKPTTVVPVPDVSSASTSTTTSICHSAYQPCIPNLPGDSINCGDLHSSQRPVTVVGGSDPYKLDADNDGVGCDS